MDFNQQEAYEQSCRMIDDVADKTGLSTPDVLNLFVQIGYREFMCAAYNQRQERFLRENKIRFKMPLIAQRDGKYINSIPPDFEDFISALENEDFKKFLDPD